MTHGNNGILFNFFTITLLLFFFYVFGSLCTIEKNV